MRTGKLSAVWRNERLGLMMIAASLAVIMLTVGLLFSYQQKADEAHIREQGVSLARVLSRMPFAQLLPAAGQQGVLSLLQYGQADPAFAYLLIVDPHGTALNEVSSPGVIAPGVPLSANPTSWLGERTLRLSSDGRAVQEFHAPLFDQGQLAGYLRLAYFKPGFGLDADQVPFFATLALPIFLLTPLFYFLVRREIRPLQTVNSQIDQLLEKGNWHRVEVGATGELRDFMDRFNHFIELARNRIDALEADRADLETSAKVLSYQRSRIESVVQSIPDAIMILDESGAVGLANARLATLLGVDPNRVIGQKPNEWCDNPEVVAFLAGCGSASTPGYRSDSVEFSPAEAPEKRIAVSAYPLFSPRDMSQILGNLVVFRDITAEMLARRSSGEFVAHVAHELKSPLNVIAMYSESLQGEDGQSEAFRIEAANVVHDEVERLSMLINNILSITKIEMGSISIERHRVKLRDLLEDTFNAVSRGGRGDDLKFIIDLPREMSPVAVDKDLMRIAINNLLTNAIKYNRPGGTVSLVAQETGGKVRICIRDTGVGIAAEDQERIFQKFFRSEQEEVRAKAGHGLGLSLVREIVQLHHGALSVSSTPGEGSEFTIEFDKETELLKQAV
jgi:signal transduction histidine kinase